MGFAEVAAMIAVIIAVGGCFTTYGIMKTKIGVLEADVEHLRNQKGNETRLALEMTIKRLDKVEESTEKQWELLSNIGMTVAKIAEWVDGQKHDKHQTYHLPLKT
jgi:uncharacterized membrane protein